MKGNIVDIDYHENCVKCRPLIQHVEDQGKYWKLERLFNACPKKAEFKSTFGGYCQMHKPCGLTKITNMFM